MTLDFACRLIFHFITFTFEHQVYKIYVISEKCGTRMQPSRHQPWTNRFKLLNLNHRGEPNITALDLSCRFQAHRILFCQRSFNHKPPNAYISFSSHIRTKVRNDIGYSFSWIRWFSSSSKTHIYLITSKSSSDFRNHKFYYLLRNNGSYLHILY